MKEWSNHINEKSSSNVRVPRIMIFNTNASIADKNDIKHLCKFRQEGNFLSFKYKTGLYLENIINKIYILQRDSIYCKIDHLMQYDYFEDYWQSYHYVNAVKDTLIREFVPVDPLSEMTKTTIESISNVNSVFIGIRKGDYSNNRASVKKYGLFGVDYYLNAMQCNLLVNMF